MQATRVLIYLEMERKLKESQYSPQTISNRSNLVRVLGAVSTKETHQLYLGYRSIIPGHNVKHLHNLLIEAVKSSKPHRHWGYYEGSVNIGPYPDESVFYPTLLHEATHKQLYLVGAKPFFANSLEEDRFCDNQSELICRQLNLPYGQETIGWFKLFQGISVLDTKAQIDFLEKVSSDTTLTTLLGLGN